MLFHTLDSLFFEEHFDAQVQQARTHIEICVEDLLRK